MNTLISKFATIPPKKQVVKIRKIEADPDSNGDENHTCSKHQHFNTTCLLHVNHPQLLKRNIYIWIYVFGLGKRNIYVYTICTSAKTRRFSPVAVRLIKHRPVPGRASSGARTGIGRFVKRFFKVPGACQTSYDARPGTVRYPDGHRWNRTI